MNDEFRCFHSRSPAEQERDQLVPGMIVDGVVGCQHPYGIGVLLPELGVWGHVNVTAMGRDSVRRGFDDYPAIGAQLSLRVLGRAPNGQLRLAAL